MLGFTMVATCAIDLVIGSMVNAASAAVDAMDGYEDDGPTYMKLCYGTETDPNVEWSMDASRGMVGFWIGANKEMYRAWEDNIQETFFSEF